MCRRSMFASVALVVALLLGPVIDRRSVAGAAPLTPRFGPEIDPLAFYDGQSTCDPTAKPGAIALRDLLEATYPVTFSLGIGRDCNVGGQSEHKEGRAYDWGVDATVASQAAMAQDFLAWLLATDSYGNQYAMARRLGIMYMIWNGQVWKSYGAEKGWQTYTGTNAHTDHVHFSLSRAGGAGLTSWYIPKAVSGPGVAAISSTRTDLFKQGDDKALWRKTFNGSTPSGWVSLGGVLSSEPAVVSRGENRIDVFARGTDNALWQKRFDGTWSEWESLGGVLTSAPAVASWDSNHLEVFARGANNALFHRRWAGSWSAWASLGGIVSSDPGAVSWGSNRIDVFARGADSALWRKWWNGSSWSGWETLGGRLTSAPTVSSRASGHLEVFARGGDNGLWHRRWAGSWSAWNTQGGILTSAAGTVSSAVDRIHVFATGADDGMWRKVWDGTWQSWEPLGATP